MAVVGVEKTVCYCSSGGEFLLPKNEPCRTDFGEPCLRDIIFDSTHGYNVLEGGSNDAGGGESLPGC